MDLKSVAFMHKIHKIIYLFNKLYSQEGKELLACKPIAVYNLSVDQLFNEQLVELPNNLDRPI